MWRERGGPAEPLERERALGGAIEQTSNWRAALAARRALVPGPDCVPNGTTRTITVLSVVYVNANGGSQRSGISSAHPIPHLSWAS